MRLYPNPPMFDPDLFRTPPTAYRGAPLWSWNTALTHERLLRQIDVMQQMGLGGFHMHVRTGLATAYLGDAFMECVRLAVERAQTLGMRAWLYDEDRWPSGAAGGLVTQDERFRARYLLWTCTPYGAGAVLPEFSTLSQTSRSEQGRLLWRYAVRLENGMLAEYRRLDAGEAAPPNACIWYAYLETALPSPWFNNQTYADTLNPAAIHRFIEVTHERYKAVIGEHFGSTVPAIFTDEPQFSRKACFADPEQTHDLTLPWTDDFTATFQQAYGTSLEDALPELFWELPNRAPSQARYRYHDHIAERFAAAFADTVGAWATANKLLLTGHMMEEPTLQVQTASLSEAMRSYRSFTLPGIDMLCDWREYTTAKQAQSAARQYGRPGVMSELYGVTNWDFPFAGHKRQGDWQAALGVTLRVHHLTWVSMAGEAKRDYPASIGEQSPWWREYPLVEDHFARLNTVLTRGTPLVRVGVVHPIESYWLCYGPRSQTQIERDERERAFADLTDWLLFGLIDFDFLAESLLPELCPPEAGAPLPVGEMRYEAVIVPGLRTIRASTLERLERFADAGGMLIFTGEIPDLVDAMPSDRAQLLAARSIRLPLSRGRLLEALAPLRDLEARRDDGRPAHTLLHQFRQEADCRYLFVCNTDLDRAYPGVRLTLRGHWQITQLDTLNGAIMPLPAVYTIDQTHLIWDFPAHGSLLIQLEPRIENQEPGTENPEAESARRSPTAEQHLVDPVPVTLAEPNVLLLDYAAYRLDDEAWQAPEEVLRLDNVLRARLGWPLRMEAQAQPWAMPPTTPEHTLSLQFLIRVDHPLEAPLLALENAAATRIRLGEVLIDNTPNGWWVDEDIQTVALPRLPVGTHLLELCFPYEPRTNPEPCYLLGDFGVDVRGRHARIIAPVRELAFGDWTHQGLPFYAGNLTYHIPLEFATATAWLHTPQFGGTLLGVAIDGHDVGRIAFAPYTCTLGALDSGRHQLDITVFGNRVNTFGCLHNSDPQLRWYGPDAWRSSGDNWSYEYRFRPMGLLVAPVVQTMT